MRTVPIENAIRSLASEYSSLRARCLGEDGIVLDDQVETWDEDREEIAFRLLDLLPDLLAVLDPMTDRRPRCIWRPVRKLIVGDVLYSSRLRVDNVYALDIDTGPYARPPKLWTVVLSNGERGRYSRGAEEVATVHRSDIQKL